MTRRLVWNVKLELARGDKLATVVCQTREVANDEHAVSFGSSPLADVVLRHPAIAALHCSLIMNDVGFVWVRDMGAKSGTRISGNPIEQTARFALGVPLQIGDTTIRLAALPRRAVAVWRVAIASAGRDPSTRVFHQSNVVVGRGKGTDLQLPGGHVSRQHCVFRVDNIGTMRVYDLGSANGVWLNGQRSTPRPLTLFDQILVGGQLLALGALPSRVPL